MRIFHFFSVHPVDVADNETPKLEHRNFFVADTAGSVVEAFEQIRGYGSIINAAEVWGIELSAPEVIATPMTQMTRIDTVQQHNDWKATRSQYQLVRRGRESIQGFFDRKYMEYRERMRAAA